MTKHSSVAKRYLQAIEAQVGRENNRLTETGVIPKPSYSKSPNTKSVRTTITSVTGESSTVNQSPGSVSNEETWAPSSPSRALDISQDLTTPGSLRRSEKIAKARKRFLHQQKPTTKSNLAEENRNSFKHQNEASNSEKIEEQKCSKAIAYLKHIHSAVKKNPPANNVNTTTRCESFDSSVTSARTSESPLSLRGEVNDTSCVVQGFDQIQEIHNDLPEEDISSLDSMSKAPSRRPSGFLEKSFDISVKEGIDLLLNTNLWANCTVPESGIACTTPTAKSRLRRRNSNPNKQDASANSSGATSPTTTPTSSSSRDARNFSWKLSQSLSSSSQCTEAATEVATNRAIDLAMKRIREIEKDGQSALAVKEAREALLKKSMADQKMNSRNHHPSRYIFSDNTSMERKAMGARSLLSLSSNESSRRDSNTNRSNANRDISKLERFGYHSLQQPIFRFQDDDNSIQSKSISSSIAAEVSPQDGTDQEMRPVTEEENDVRNPACLSVSTERIHRRGTSLREKYAFFENHAASQNILIPDLKSNVNDRTQKNATQTRTFRVATPTAHEALRSLNVSPCVSPPQIVRHAQSFEESSPDPVFCIQSSSVYSSAPNSLARTSSTVSHSFGSEDAMFMMDISEHADSTLGPDSLSSFSSRHAFKSIGKKTTLMPSGFRRQERLPYSINRDTPVNAQLGKGEGRDTKLLNRIHPPPPRINDTISTTNIHTRNTAPNEPTKVTAIPYSIASGQLGVISTPAQGKPNGLSDVVLPSHSASQTAIDEVVEAATTGNMNSLNPIQQAKTKNMAMDLHFLKLNPPPPPPPPIAQAPLNSTSYTPSIQSTINLNTTPNTNYQRQEPEAQVASKAKVAQTFLGAIAKSSNGTSSENQKAIVLTGAKQSSKVPQQNRRTLSTHVSAKNMIRDIDGNPTFDMQSIRSAFESIQQPSFAEEDESDDDTASVKSLRERYEGVPPKSVTQKSENISSIAKIRALFESKDEPKKCINAKPFQSSKSTLHQTFSKFEDLSARNVSKSSVKSITQPLRNIDQDRNPDVNGSSHDSSKSVQVSDRVRYFAARKADSSSQKPLSLNQNKFNNKTTNNSIIDKKVVGRDALKPTTKIWKGDEGNITLNTTRLLSPISVQADLEKREPDDNVTDATNPISSSNETNDTILKESIIFSSMGKDVTHAVRKGIDHSRKSSTSNTGPTKYSPWSLNGKQLSRTKMSPSNCSDEKSSTVVSGKEEARIQDTAESNGSGSLDVSCAESKHDSSLKSTSIKLVPSFLGNSNESVSEEKASKIESIKEPIQVSSVVAYPMDMQPLTSRGTPKINDVNAKSTITNGHMNSFYSKAPDQTLAPTPLKNGDAVAKNITQHSPKLIKPLARKLITVDSSSNPATTIIVAKQVKPRGKGDIETIEASGRLEPFSSFASDQKPQHVSNGPAESLRLPVENKPLVGLSTAPYPLPKGLQMGELAKYVESSSSAYKRRSISSSIPACSKDSNSNDLRTNLLRSGQRLDPTKSQVYPLHAETSTMINLRPEFQGNNLKTEREIEDDSESEFSDGVTLDVSIAEVSNLTTSTFLMSKTCDRSSSTHSDDKFIDRKSSDFIESEAKRSEASSSQTSEAAHPLLAKAMRLRPMSDEYSHESLSRTKSLLARHWGNGSTLRPKFDDNNVMALGETKVENSFDDTDGLSGWDIQRIETSFPTTENMNGNFNLDSYWNPFAEVPVLPFGVDTVKIRSDKVHVQGPSTWRKPYTSVVTKTRDKLAVEKTWQKRALVVQKATNKPETNADQPNSGLSISTISTTMLNADINTDNRPSGKKNLSDWSASSISQVHSDPTPKGWKNINSVQKGASHATVMARLSRLKESRMQRAAAIETVRRGSSVQFSQYGSRTSETNSEDHSASSVESSTQFGGSSFLAALDVD